jgi:hypothetical protein
VPCATLGRDSTSIVQTPVSAAPLGEEAIAEAIAQLCLGRDMGAAGDPVIAGAGLLRVDEKGEGAASGDLLDIGDAEHGVGIGRPLDPVAGEVPAIGRLAHTGEDLLEVESGASPGADASPLSACAPGSPKSTTLAAPCGCAGGTGPFWTSSFEHALTDRPFCPMVVTHGAPFLAPCCWTRTLCNKA